mmetsp:Transcript_16918/g.48613  ORF Transcript_16918/g.48613 Transcript_16918/m.48613 type:complete len:204 (-) Transcript_16918:513-1124(-)
MQLVPMPCLLFASHRSAHHTPTLAIHLFCNFISSIPPSYHIAYIHHTRCYTLHRSILLVALQMRRVLPLPHLVVLGLLPHVIELHHLLARLGPHRPGHLVKVLPVQGHAGLEDADLVRVPPLHHRRAADGAGQQPEGRDALGREQAGRGVVPVRAEADRRQDEGGGHPDVILGHAVGPPPGRLRGGLAGGGGGGRRGGWWCQR